MDIVVKVQLIVMTMTLSHFIYVRFGGLVIQVIFYKIRDVDKIVDELEYFIELLYLNKKSRLMPS